MVSLSALCIFTGVLVQLCGAQRSVQLESKFQDCSGAVTYSTARLSNVDFEPYLEITASSSTECATACFERLRFCHSVSYNSRTNVCKFAYRSYSCRSSKFSQPSRADREQLLYCFKCSGRVTQPLNRPPNHRVTPRPIRFTTPRSRTVRPNRRTTTRRPFITRRPVTFPRIPIKPRTTPHPIFTRRPITYPRRITTRWTPVPTRPRKTTILTTTTKRSTYPPTTTEKQIIAQTTIEKQINVQTRTEKQTVAPTTSEKQTVASTTEKQTIAQTTIEKQINVQTQTEKQTVALTTTDKQTVVPTTSEKQTVAPTISEKQTVALTTTDKQTVVPTTSEKQTVAPTTSEKQTVAPTTSTASTEPSTTNKIPDQSPITTEVLTAPHTTPAEKSISSQAADIQTSTFKIPETRLTTTDEKIAIVQDIIGSAVEEALHGLDNKQTGGGELVDRQSQKEIDLIKVISDGSDESETVDLESSESKIFEEEPTVKNGDKLHPAEENKPGDLKPPLSKIPKPSDIVGLINPLLIADERPNLKLTDLAEEFHEFLPPKSFQRQFQAKSNCSDENLMPCKYAIGRNCETVLRRDGCYGCVCPHKSVARGCLGVVFRPIQEKVALIEGTRLCPNNEKAQLVTRYFRKIESQNGSDKCVPIREPYCASAKYENMFQMPRSLEECQYFCYTNKELDERNIGKVVVSN